VVPSVARKNSGGETEWRGGRTANSTRQENDAARGVEKRKLWKQGQQPPKNALKAETKNPGRLRPWMGERGEETH